MFSAISAEEKYMEDVRGEGGEKETVPVCINIREICLTMSI